jgi:Tir chaperone protein (CesT) family
MIDYAASAMKGSDDIESYLLKIGLPFEAIGPEMWNIKADHENLVVSIAGTLVVFRTKVMDLPAANREQLYETLLRLNTTEMVHGAFGIEDKSIVIVNALELENLDFNEFSAVVDDFTLSVEKHYETLSKFRAAA